MPKAFIIVFYRNSPEREKLDEYAPKAFAAMKGFGANFLARGNPAKIFESGLQERVVVVEFDDVDAAEKAYLSEPYQAAFRLLGDVERDVRIIETMD